MLLLAELHKNALAGVDNQRDLQRSLERLATYIEDTYMENVQRIRSKSDGQVRKAEQVLS